MSPTTSSKTVLSLVAGFLALLAAPLIAGTAEWTGGGPDGGTVRGVAHDPTSPGRVLAGPDRSPTYRSLDGGVTWVPSGQGMTLDSSFTLAASSDGTFYALSTTWFSPTNVEVFRSTDGGASWQDVSPSVPGLRADAMAVDPVDSDTVYVLTRSQGVYKTSDGGGTWATSNNGLPTPLGSLYDIVIDPSNPSVVYLGGFSVIYKSLDGGANWSEVIATPVIFLSIAIDPTDPQTLLGAGYSVYKSTDAGATWTEVLDEGGYVVAIHPLQPSLYLVGTTRFLSTSGSIFRSTDGGATWQETSPPRYLGSVMGFSFDPFGSTNILAATDVGPLRSTDGGASWTRRVAGMEAFPALSVASPTTAPDQVVAVGAYVPGIFRTSNGGSTWTEVDEVFDAFPVRVAASDPSRYYAVPWSYRDLLRSDDGGVTWRRVIVDGSPFGPAGPVILDLGIHPLDPDGVIALNRSYPYGTGALPPAILRSTDGGIHWTSLYEPSLQKFDEVRPGGIAIDPNDPDHMLVGLELEPKQGPDETVILRTVDGGVSWSESKLGGRYFVPSIAFDAVKPRRAWATLYTGGATPASTLLGTEDGGETWNEILTGLPCLSFVTTDPRRSGHVYRTCNGVHRSVDFGRTWEAIDPESFPTVSETYDLSVSSTVPRVVHVGTTQGVYSNTTGVILETSGSCPGIVNLRVSNAPPNTEVAVLAAANHNGWVKGSGLCNGAAFEIGEPFRLPPTLVKVGADGNGSAETDLPANRCWVEAMSFSNCTTSGAVLVE